MNSNIRLYVSIIWICIMILSIVMVCYKHNLRQYILPGLGGLLINTLLIYHIDLYTKTLEKDQKYNISKLIICIITMVLLSYYLTRWNDIFPYLIFFL